MSDWQDGYRAAVADFLLRNGSFVRLSAYGRYDYSTREDDNSDYDGSDVVYGWHDWDSKHRASGCSVPVTVDISSIRERTISQFQGTFTENLDEVGIEVRATCECRYYTDRWLRWTGSLGQILNELLSFDIKIDRSY